MGEDAAARRPPGVPAFLSSVSSWFKPYRRLCAIVSAGLIMEAAFVSGMPLLFQALIDRAIVPRRPDLLFELLGVLLTSALIVSGASVGRDFLYARLITTVASDLRIKLFDRLTRLSPDYFRRTAVADISSRFSNDLTSVEHALSTLVAWLILPALDIVIGTVLLFMIDWRLGLIAQLLWPLSLLGPQWIGPRASLAAMELKSDQARLLALVEEVSSGQAVVRAFGLRDHVSSTFRRAVDDVARRGVRVHFLSSMMERSSGIGIRLMQVLVLGAGAWLAFHDSLSIGALVAFQTLFTSVAFSLGYVSQYMPALVQAAVGLDRIEHLLADDSGIADTAGAVTLPADWKELTLDHVSFAPEGRAIIDDVSLRVASGESVALVGRSGSGKSTLLNLIMRSYDPTSGSVSLDGHDYRMATHDSLARQQAAVFQESFLFNTSLRENIRLGRPEASGAEVGDAARMAGLDDVIASLPDGLDALVGERGGGLSGGQRQRVAIARALLRNPRLLLLDEATSALDVGLETELNRTLADVRRGRTVISVSHRLSAIADYDRIVVLENGRVAEQGSHDELLALGGTYRALWQKQSGFRVSSTGDQAGVDAARLKAIPLLRSLSLETLDRLARRFATERVPAERTVVQQGDAGDRFYIIVRGMVNVFVEDGDDEREVATLEVGDHFGEIALLEDTPRTATVRTVVPSVFITLSREDFLGLLDGSPELRGLLSQRVASRHGSLASGASRDIREI